jgi:hypothetical protein
MQNWVLKMADNAPKIYDAVKRREYYLRTRKLKGRKPGSGIRPAVKNQTRAQKTAEHRRKQEAQISALKGRLAKLQEVLAAETKQAKARSGVKTSKSSTDQKSSSNSDSKHLTPAEKAKAAKASADYRKKNPNPSLSDQVKSLTEKIKTIQERIAKMREDGSIGARKPATK